MAQKRQLKSTVRRVQLLEAAKLCFKSKGYEETTIRDIAAEAGSSLGLSYNYFPDKSSYALAIYNGLASRMQDFVIDLAPGTIGERFSKTMKFKIELLEKEREVLLGLLPVALNPKRREGVMGEAAEWIRVAMSQVFRQVISQASNAPPAKSKRLDRATGMLYGAHLLLVLLWSQDQSAKRKATTSAIDIAAELFDKIGLLRFVPGSTRMSKRIDQVLTSIYAQAGPTPDASLVRQVTKVITKRYRGSPQSKPNLSYIESHISYFMKRGEPIHFVLPAFPAKSPNAQKVLGKLPDLAEVVALQSLSDLCDEIGTIYKPGASLTICSDGHVFADVVGVKDEDVLQYRKGIQKIIRKHKHKALTLFDLADVYADTHYEKARELLLAKYGEEPQTLQKSVKNNPSLKHMFNGVHRFMSEDGFVRHPTLSRNAVRKQAKQDALEVMIRSRAWGALLQDCFPDALRLSIHPQVSASQKIGVHLIPTTDAWLTPWHGVALLKNGGFELMHRKDAEALGAELVLANQIPSHFEV